jgi:hypothetical protein
MPCERPTSSSSHGGECVNLLHERPLAERSPQGEEHLVEVERFGDVIVRAEFHGLDRGLAPAIRRDDDHGHVFDAFGVPREDRETVPLRHLQIEQCGGDGRIGERLGRRIAVRRFADDIPFRAQQQCEIGASGGIVVRHENRGFHNRSPGFAGNVRMNVAPEMRLESSSTSPSCRRAISRHKASPSPAPSGRVE